MRYLLTILMILASVANATVINRSSNPQLYPTTDPIIAYQQNELILNVRLPYHTNLNILMNYTLAAYTNAQLLETFLPTNTMGVLSTTSPYYTVTYTIPESDMHMPPQQYLFEGKAGQILLFSTILDVKASGGTNLLFNGPYSGPYNTVYVAGRGWIPFNQASNGTPTLAQVLAEGGNMDISAATGYLAENIVGLIPGSTEFSTNGTVIGSGSGINLIGNWPGSYFSGGVLHLLSAGGGTTTYVTNLFQFGDTITTIETLNVTADSVIAGDVQATGDVNLLGNIYSYITNVFAPILNISITNIIGAIENNIVNNVFNTNIVNMVNNIGGVQVFVSNTLSFGYSGGTSTPPFVYLYSGGNLFTGYMAGATLYLYGEGGGGGALGAVTNILAAAPLYGNRVGDQFYIGWGSYEGLGLSLIPWTNTATLLYSGITNQFVCNQTQYVAHIWGAAGNGAAAGYTEINFYTTNNEILNYVVGQGGLVVTSPATIMTNTGSAFGGGGIGYGRGSGQSAMGGGGFSGIQRASTGEWLGIAGGGGNGQGSGGGLSGSSRGSSTDASAGTQTAGGSPITPFTYSNHNVTNHTGTAFRGGDGSITNNTAIAASGGGGGGGWFGGGGTYIAFYSGGGSGYVSTNVIGNTIRASGNFPPNIESPYYPLASPAIGAIGTGVNNTRGGNGAIVIRAPVPL